MNVVPSALIFSPYLSSWFETLVFTGTCLPGPSVEGSMTLKFRKRFLVVSMLEISLKEEGLLVRFTVDIMQLNLSLNSHVSPC